MSKFEYTFCTSSCSSSASLNFSIPRAAEPSRRIRFLGTIATSEAYIKAGRIKPLVVFSAKRSSALPQTATVGEQGFPDLQSDYWIGIMGPAKLPAPVVAKLNADFNAVLKMPEIRDRLIQIGVEPLGGTSDDMERYYRKELATWAAVVREAGIERK